MYVEYAVTPSPTQSPVHLLSLRLNSTLEPFDYKPHVARWAVWQQHSMQTSQTTPLPHSWSSFIFTRRS